MKANLYKVYYSKPGRSGYRQNGVYHVISTGVLKAAAMCEAAEPDCEIWNVVHGGRVEHIDPNVITAIADENRKDLPGEGLVSN